VVCLVRSSTQPTAASPKHPIFGRDDFTASDAKQLSFLIPFVDDRLYLREPLPFV